LMKEISRISCVIVFLQIWSETTCAIRVVYSGIH
jgi:hypothetical protein